MVLWEITLGTAYFLGLKRTYKLALRIQRRLVGPKHPKIRQYLHRKTRAIFDVALKVHREVQQRDIEVGRNLGNWILRWLDKMKPGAQIRRGHAISTTQSNNININNNNNNAVKSTKTQTINSSNYKPSQTSNTKNGNPESSRRLFSSIKSNGAMMRSAETIGINTQYRHFKSTSFGYDGVIRNDIMQWMMHK